MFMGHCSLLIVILHLLGEAGESRKGSKTGEGSGVSIQPDIKKGLVSIVLLVYIRRVFVDAHGCEALSLICLLLV